jgi:hypothetical protein
MIVNVNCNWLLFSWKKLFKKWFTEYCMLVENVSNVIKEWPTLSIWWKQLSINSKSLHFKNEYLGKPIGPA